jgi:hypothetical protein
MGRVVRSLMKMPPVRRVMLRLANAEAAIARQQSQLGDFDVLLQRLSTDEANHRALLAQVSEHMPPERRANLEAALAQQRSELSGVKERIQRLIADGADQRALVAEVAEHMPPARLKKLEATIAEQRVLLAEVAEHMPPARLNELQKAMTEQRALLAEVAEHMPPSRRADLEAAVQESESAIRGLEADLQGLQSAAGEQDGAIKGLEAAAQAQDATIRGLQAASQTQEATIKGLEAATQGQDADVKAQAAQIAALNQRIEQLSVDRDSHRTLLAEVSQHLPPAQRANLEATLHGQQLQLGALNSTIHANQVQLGALNDIAQRLTAENASQRELLAQISAQVPPTRLAALEATIAELKTRLDDLNNLVPRLVAEEAAHRAAMETMQRRAAIPHTFEQLLNRQFEKSGVDLAVNIHIPKACGNSSNALFRQLGFVPISLDMNTNDFFHTIREDRWLEGYLAPPPRDAYLLTGHLRLDHPIFRRILPPHVIVTVLRDPIDRILSHYNFTTRTPGAPWYDEVVSSGMTFPEYAAKIFSAIGPQYGFFDDSGKGTFAPTGTATAKECFENLVTRVGFYGLAERFDEFAVLIGYLLGRTEILATAAINVTRELPDLNGIPLKTSLSKAERSAITKLLKDDIWFYEKAREEYDRRLADPRLQSLLSKTMPLFKSSQEAMGRLLAMKDPGDPSRPAFRQPR